MWWRSSSALLAGILLWSLWFLLCSCGYRIENGAPALPSWISSVYVEPFSNQSNELDLGAMITRELRSEFLKGAALTLSDQAGADVVLKGRVVQVDTSGLSYVRYDQAIERRIVVRCHVSIVDPKTGEELWSTADIVREEGFYVGRDVMETEANKRRALEKAAADIAEIVYHRMTGIF